MRNGHSLSEWRALVDDLWAKSPGLDKEKITAAVEEFRKIYDELFSLMNQVRIRNGYEPVDYRHGYFPHFDDAKGESLLGRAFKAANMKDVPLKDRLAALVGKGLDVNTEVNALPTSINGLTHTFKPGIRWVGNIMRRQGFDTTFDAVEGFDRVYRGRERCHLSHRRYTAAPGSGLADTIPHHGTGHTSAGGRDPADPA